MSTETIADPRSSEVAKTEHTRSGQYYRPHVDIVEQAEELLVRADMPGLRAEDIDVQFEEGTLAIHGRVAPRQPAGTNYLQREYGVGDYYRSFQVSEHIDVSRIHAEYTDGVLTLHLPKTEAVKPRKIAVTAK
ncbi:MAG: Hsp20/alpha crystallin family protein [Pirellulales bacterium]|nr:Hsp20/alpha crystallin family protein [Pirellulales bacterium]